MEKKMIDFISYLLNVIRLYFWKRYNRQKQGKDSVATQKYKVIYQKKKITILITFENYRSNGKIKFPRKKSFLSVMINWLITSKNTSWCNVRAFKDRWICQGKCGNLY